jgi:hypothetical protein
VNASASGAVFLPGMVGFPGPIRNPAPGTFCIAAPPGTVGHALALTIQGSVGWIDQSSANTCSSTEFEVHTFALDNSGSIVAVNVPFGIVVP